MSTIQATFQFYGHLNRFLLHAHQERQFMFQFEGHRSIKDLIESMGVPHTELATLLVNNNPVDFSYRVQDGDNLRIYPRNYPIGGKATDVNADDKSMIENTIQPQPEGELRFVADIHLGRLVAHLRMLGFDTLYPEDYRDEELARLSSVEDRILLTRDRGLLKRSIVKYGYYVLHTDPYQQLAEVIQRFNLLPRIASFARCTECNGVLQPVEKATISDKLQPKTLQYYNEFRQCQSCGKIYWRGSHYGQMEDFLEKLRMGENSSQTETDLPDLEN